MRKNVPYFAANANKNGKPRKKRPQVPLSTARRYSAVRLFFLSPASWQSRHAEFSDPSHNHSLSAANRLFLLRRTMASAAERKSPGDQVGESAQTVVIHYLVGFDVIAIFIFPFVSKSTIAMPRFGGEWKSLLGEGASGAPLLLPRTYNRQRSLPAKPLW